MKATTKRDLNISKLNRHIPKDTIVDVEYNAYKNIIKIKAADGTEINIRAINAANALTGFIKEPSMKSLEKWVSDGIGKSIIGKKVEPDGFDFNGMPSWLLVLGII